MICMGKCEPVNTPAELVIIVGGFGIPKPPLAGGTNL